MRPFGVRPLLRSIVVAVFVSFAMCSQSIVATAATLLSTTEAYRGIDYEVYSTEGTKPTTIHVLRVDLSSAEITVIATKGEERGVTPSQFAANRGAQIVINGDLFNPSQFRPSGIARGGGVTWGDSADSDGVGFVAFAKTAIGTEVTVSSPVEVVGALGEEVTAAVGGRPLLVAQGAALDPACDDAPALPCVAAPRTAVGVSADGRTLFFIVVDGWQAGSQGLRSAELAIFLSADLGVRNALQLDSASASAMVIESQGGLVSSPSDGAERPVANHLAIVHGQLGAGTIRGGVFDTVIAGDKIVGATVTLDTGETTTYTGEMLWSFVVAPRYVCVTGSAPGYQDQTQCRQVGSGENAFASMALLPIGASEPDGGAGGGAPGGETSSGGCGVSRSGDSNGGERRVLVLLAVLAWWVFAPVIFRRRFR